MKRIDDVDKLEDIFEMQKELQEKMFNKKLPVDSVPDFHYSITALVGEIGEVLEADKRWKNARADKYDKNAKLEELVDCMAFLVNTCLYSGFDYKEVYTAFVDKFKKNMNRSI